MPELFLDILNLSIAASWLIGAVLLLRIFLRNKAPKWVSCLLWGFVGLRLVFPFTFESEISLAPNRETFDTDVIYYESSVPEESETSIYVPETDDYSIPVIPSQNTETDRTPPYVQPPQYVDSGIDAIDDKVNPMIYEQVDFGEDKLQKVTGIASYVWLFGIAVMLVYAAVNYILLKKRISVFVPDENGIRRSENVGSPFIFGVFRPRIYLPFGLDENTERHIIAHEKAHLKRLDHLIKPVGFVILSVYWFNPLVWAAYILLCRDIEMACDERVVKNMTVDDRKAYATALLKCGIKRSVIAACPVAFGEVGVKKRVKNALSYKKPVIWIIVGAVLISSVVALVFLTSPKDGEDAPSQEESSVETSEESTEESTEESSAETGKEPGEDSDSEISKESSEPESSEPESSEPESSEPESSEPESTESESSEPESTEPESSEPESSEPESSEPESSEPESSEPESSEPESSEPEVVEPEIEVVEPTCYYAVREDRTTPDGYSVGSGIDEYCNTDVVPIYVNVFSMTEYTETSVWNRQREYSPIEKSGLKIWICQDGTKVDYSYTNDNGIAMFAVPEGKYTFELEANGEYVTSYNSTVEIIGDVAAYWSRRGTGTWFVFDATVKTYSKNAPGMTIYLRDSDTLEPIKNQRFEIVTPSNNKEYAFRTNEYGYADVETIFRFMNEADDYIYLRCISKDYEYASVFVNYWDSYNIELKLVKKSIEGETNTAVYDNGDISYTYFMWDDHQTPENVEFPLIYNGRYVELECIRLQTTSVSTGDRTNVSENIEVAGAKIWICDKYGNKIDYVYTNSKGIALFEMPPYSYTVCLEGIGDFPDFYCDTIWAPSFAFYESEYYTPQRGVYEYGFCTNISAERKAEYIDAVNNQTTAEIR